MIRSFRERATIAATTIPPAAREVIAGLFGVCIAWCCASCLAFFFKSGILPAPHFLPHDVHAVTIKGAQELLFLAFYVLGPIFALVLSFYSARVVRNGFAVLIGIVLFVPLSLPMAEAVTSGGDFASWLEVTAFVLAAAFIIDRQMLPAGSETGVVPPPASGHHNLSRADRLCLVLCGLVLVACLAPISLASVAAVIGYNFHPVSFYIAPAMYLWTRGLVPGIDFFPQYGIGIGALFSPLLRSTVGATMENTVLATVVLSSIYFVSALFALRRFFESIGYAFAVTLFALLLNFHTANTTWPAIFFDPSAYPARYPFVFLFVWCFARAVKSGHQKRDLAIAGALAGLCIFWNTETGTYVVISALAATVLLRWGKAGMLSSICATAGGIASGFFLPSFFAYGPGIFQRAFFQGLFEPFFTYAAGLGAISTPWGLEHGLYTMVSPMVALATIGWSTAMLVRKDAFFDREQLVVLFLLSCIGSGLMLKWVNMSIDVLWMINALPLVAVMAWWVQVGIRALCASAPPARAKRRAGRLQAAFLVLMTIFVVFVQDDTHESRYGFQAFAIYPSLLLAPLVPMSLSTWSNAAEPSKADLALIHRCSPANERTMIIGQLDWILLLESRRTPRMPWLPGETINAFPFLVDRAFSGDEPVFLDKDVLHTPLGEPLQTALRNRLRAYHPGPRATTLRVYLRPNQQCVS